MKQSIPLLQFIGFLFTSVGGVLLHFLYDWTNQSLLTAPFSAVNESTWEHMKLLFVPMFIYSLIESHFLDKREDYWCVKLIGIVSGLLLIPVLFYTGRGIFGEWPDWVNLLIFFLSVAVTYVLEGYLFRHPSGQAIPCPAPWLAFIIICLIAMVFVHFTFFPPKLPLFQNPLDGGCGF
ncbi:MAG: hypothetical protein IJN46_05710 [Lachnospiraceae bacterium]|nr:hypothetical protein [Lachnospiraceae bacterium]